MDVVSLGNRIREVREAQGLTQEELAARTGLSIKHLSVLERGLKEPRLTTFLLITEALETTPNELLTAPAACNYISDIVYKASKLSPEKQEKLLKIVNTLVEEL